MNELDLRGVVERIQRIVEAETGRALGAQGEGALAKILRNVASHNFSGNDSFEATEVTILLADLRGFTSIAGSYPAGTVLSLVNRCLITMSEVVFSHQGAIDKFMGDAIMVLFTQRAGDDNPVRRAVHCAVDMQLAMDELNAHYQVIGFPEVFLGIGLNTGPVMAGTLGSEFYSAYTVIGDEVNIAARIEGFSLRGQVLITESTFKRCSDFVETGEPEVVHVKGKLEPITVREVLGIPSTAKVVPRREVRRSPRVRVRLSFTYQLIEADVTASQRNQGTVLDIGYHGIRAELECKRELFTEIKLEIDLPLVDYKASDIYAKIVKIEQREEGYFCGIEFTAASSKTGQKIRQFVQTLMEGSERS